MSDEGRNPQQIFNRAIEIESREERQSFLNQECQGDDDLRERVEGLIEASQAAGSFLEEPIAKIDNQSPSEFLKPVDAAEDETTDQENTADTLANIGPYKLLQQIGEGGMGSVYMAQQE